MRNIVHKSKSEIRELLGINYLNFLTDSQKET